MSLAGERKFNEREVREILRSAESEPAKKSGLTLSELQSVAAEVGLDPTSVARAAARIETRQRPLRTQLGLPLEVSHIAPLKRSLTDREWQMLVAELRSTFRAKGQVNDDVGMREWWNGNLHACIEPTESGYQLRMGSYKSNARIMNLVGGVSSVTALVIAGIAFATANPALGITSSVFSLPGIGVITSNLARVPHWARTRLKQMQDIEGKLRAMMSATDSKL